MTNNMLFAPLARMNTDGSIDYVIADSIETSEDGLVYTVKIKENLKWSDGEPLTAEDVVYSYNAENEAMQTFYVNGAPITFENPDDLTVVITLPEVSANAMELLTSENFVLPKHVFESKGTFDINLLQDEIVCSGPYTLKEYQAGQHLYFTKNPNYALGEAKTENVVFKIIEKQILHLWLSRMAISMHGLVFQIPLVLLKITKITTSTTTAKAVLLTSV